MQVRQSQLLTLVMDRHHRSEVGMLKEQQNQHYITLARGRRHLQI